jgi:type I restriction enzyme M protein
MLDTDTKRRIDTARDILVGKVPDPKSQVEQITIALIYKFMDDMDAESEGLGGKRKFFTGDFARYGWAKIMQPGIGGHEMLGLYAEGITKMPENPGIPPLFRDIFKNAYLPYRDPETLKAFLKIIDEFSYDHSERLGDAFEYLLSVLGSQGDAGQFRTPRHIIDFMVEVIAPQKNETILDPACGTAGFLISAYKHILRANSDAKGHSTLTPDERVRLASNFKGYDISPDMVRLSLVNLYLHGFTDPHIYEYDTLTSEERWNECADVILANPPFMSPKGGIKPHKRFSIQAKRSEVLFVDYMAEHLTPTGRAAIIVPEGIIFQSGKAYRQLRATLINEHLIGVISLPSGVFMPYTGVKTSILVLDRTTAKRMPSILFSEIKHIGFSLGVKRTASEYNDLPTVLDDYRALYAGGELSRCSWLASREEILANDCNLSGSRYRPVVVNGDTRMVKVADVCSVTKGSSSSTTTSPGPYPLILTAAESKTSATFQFDGPAVCVPLISSLGHGKAALHRIHLVDGKFALANLLVALRPKDESELDARFLFHTLDMKRAEIAALMRGAANVSMKPEDIAQFEIPLPPLEVQKEIVAEIEGYQKVINGARAVLDHYRPHIPIDPDWPMVVLGEVIESKPKNGYSGSPVDYVTELKVLSLSATTSGAMDLSKFKYLDEHIPLNAQCRCRRGDIYLQRGNTKELVGTAAIFDTDDENYIYPDLMIRVRADETKIQSHYLLTVLQSGPVREFLTRNAVGAAGSMPKINQSIVESVPIPLPPLTTQQSIMVEIEAEQALVAANRELIVRFEKKIQATLVRIWGEPEETAESVILQ